MKHVRYLLLALVVLANNFGVRAYTHQDTLRGSNGRGRSWWDVQKYDLSFKIDTQNHTINGTVQITFRVIATPTDSMQIDLQEGMELRYPSGYEDLHITPIKREGNVCWIIRPFRNYEVGTNQKIQFQFSGKPKNAINPPWDGGFIWKKDPEGHPWIAVACQGVGASSWWPCKDYQGDEPDSGITFNLSGPQNLRVISNGQPDQYDTTYIEDPVTGKLTVEIRNVDTSTFNGTMWRVKNPINSYDLTFYLGNYSHWHDTMHGESGVLDLDFYPLKVNTNKAFRQWKETKNLLRCYEYWLGPYPFYQDGYKLVEAPYLGMEHQSAIAYGNHYQMGYLGSDRSGTGVGLSFDYILIHESAHEWFGNSITARDIADNWIHEGITTYMESLYAEWTQGKAAGERFCMGEWNNIQNDRPVIGHYGVNEEGSNDMYDKCAAIMFMVRAMIGNDSVFRQLLRGLNKDFYHKITDTKEVEAYIARYTGKDLTAFFDQYLRHSSKPELDWSLSQDHRSIEFHWLNAVAGFNAPVAISVDGGKNYYSYNVAPAEIKAQKKKFRRKKVLVRARGYYDIVTPLNAR